VTRPGSLLLVDDNEMNRDALSRLLRLRGFSVTLACDGVEAVAQVETAAFDLVLLDVEMPGISGLEVLRRIRAAHSQTELPVIMVTARSGGEDVVEAFRLGANDYVTKPIDFPVALARIGTHLAHKWATEDLRESEERYSLAVSGANDGLWDWNLVTNRVYWSPRWKAMLGYEDADIAGNPEEWLNRVHPEDLGRVTDGLAAHLASGSGHFESEHRLLHRNETFRWVRCRGAAVRNSDGTATRLAGSLTDITDTKLADALTGLPNRILFLDLIERAIKRTSRRRGYVFALLVLGLDRFSVVNDSLGPTSADRLLVEVARRLQTTLRATDTVARDESSFTLARIGGDEFNVLLDDITDVRDAIGVAERLRRALEEPFEIDGHQVFTSAKTGIAVSTSGYEEPDAILRDATTALNRAKTQGTSPYEIFDPAMRARAISRLRVETDLRHAIEHEAFEVHYQPIIALQTGRIAGFEALLRWRHPSRGLVSPAEFIPLAEDTGMILDIGRLALAESCRQMQAWQVRFGAAAPGVMCANVSSRQLADGDLVGEIAMMLDRTGLPGSKLKLEITESAFVTDVPRARGIMARAKAMGIEWSLDDFGTGYSSLSYLHQFRVNTLKVDRSFVNLLGREGNVSEMVRAIVVLAHSLGMDVVAEGVETVEQYAELQSLGCEFAQGYYFSKPVDVSAAGHLIASQPWCSIDSMTA
jgi:diguanylate cyclase (GGDEF)-like protein/PAS domain S-box-containing protein